MTITCEFLTSRYVAKATHLEPEWPPHPARLFYALVSALHVFRSERNENGDPEERKALEWLEALDHPDVLAAHRDQIGMRRVVTHHVPGNDPESGGRKPHHLPEHRVKSERHFPTLLLSDTSNRVHFSWPNIVPGETHEASLRRLFERVSYLGHSSSLVALDLVVEDLAESPGKMVRWTPAPGGRGGMALRSFAKGLLGVLDQVYEPNEFSQQNYRLPHESVHYIQASSTDETISAVPASHFDEQWIVYRFPDWLRIPVPAVFSLTTNLKTEACRLADEASLSSDLKALLSGHQAGTGRPFEGPHVAFVGLPYVGHSNASGALFGLAVILPRESGEAHRGSGFESIRRFLHRVASVPFHGQPVPLERLKTADLARLGSAATLRPGQWCASSKVWASVTPVALDKYPGFLFGRARKTEGEVTRTEKAFAEARASLRQSCVNIGLPAPVGVDISRFSWIEQSLPVSAFVAPRRAQPKPSSVLAHVRLTFEDEVRGPILLGKRRYLGLGLLRPLSR